jgi:anti-sigma B factor antagonist
MASLWQNYRQTDLWRSSFVELTLDSGAEGAAAIVTVVGEVDVYSAPALGDRIDALLADGRRWVVIDLDRVDFIDSTGIGVLVAGLNRLRSVGGRLDLAGPSNRVVKLLRITNLDEVFSLYASVEEAVASTDDGPDVTDDTGQN